VSSDKFYYITTAIDYANGSPHMGHALEKIGADAMARYRRRKGERVHFVMGMDEHGVKVLQSAEASGTSPQEWVDRVAEEFQALWRTLGISNDDFMRTTQPRHREAVQEIVRRMQAAGDLYRGKYEGYYCIGCEAFKRDDELEGTPPNVRCPIHPTRELQWTTEENWFFRLSHYQERLLKLIDDHPEFAQPEIRRNEIRKVIEGGLEDISVSRSRIPWGVPWPGDEEQTVYVWIDALTNYLAATGFPADDYTKYWPADCHVIGKDITRFHCLYWPAMLMSADVAVPRSVWAHGFITLSGDKISKSEGVRFELSDAIERHGPEALRYYLLREIPWNGDGEFSWERFDQRYTSDLANDFGNLVNRSISMVERYRGGVVPESAETSLDTEIAAALLRYRAAMDANLLHQGAAAAMGLASASNSFIEQRAPWAQAKDPALSTELDATLASLVRALIALTTMLEPFMPLTMLELARRLSLEGVPLLDEVLSAGGAGRHVTRGEVLFPKEKT
jgi:methionyl-tRNA synthetase